MICSYKWIKSFRIKKIDFKSKWNLFLQDYWVTFPGYITSVFNYRASDQYAFEDLSPPHPFSSEMESRAQPSNMPSLKQVMRFWPESIRMMEKAEKKLVQENVGLFGEEGRSISWKTVSDLIKWKLDSQIFFNFWSCLNIFVGKRASILRSL